jgi:hypothetical protein
MKKLLPIIFLLTALATFANDTLTRAQVYNFSVGDTFDYINYGESASWGWDSGGYPSYSGSYYSRYIVTDIYYSLDSSTKYIVRLSILYPTNLYDTMVLQNLSGVEVFLDTTSNYSVYEGHISMNSSSRFNGRPVDSLYQFYGSPGFEDVLFADGLGMVSQYTWGGCGPCGGSYYDSLVLIYYAKGTEIWGTPYYNSPLLNVGIQSIAVDNKIVVYPTLSDGIFYIKTTDAGILPVTVTIYDQSGKELKQISLGNLNNQIDVGPHSDGIYIWKAMSANGWQRTGKIVVH